MDSPTESARKHYSILSFTITSNFPSDKLRRAREKSFTQNSYFAFAEQSAARGAI